MNQVKPFPDSLKLETGYLCLDFADTAEWHASDHPEEHLNSYADLVAWAQKVGILSDYEGQRLAQEAVRRPTDAVEVLEQAIALREAIYRIFSSTAAGRLPEAIDLITLNDTLPKALTRLQIVQTADGFTWGWAGDEDMLDRMLWPVARSAADLLTSDQLDRVKECEDDRGCGYLFLDTSRNRSRRWCDMKSCGNRAKVQRHRKQKRAAGIFNT